MRAVSIVSTATLAIALVACAATGSNSFTSSTGAGGSGSTTSETDINLGGGLVGTGGGSGSAGCSAAATLVYVLATSDDIYSFDPPSKKFTHVAKLNCVPSGALTPNSMAIDRNAVAWINYVAPDDSKGVVYKFDLGSQKCEATPTVTLPVGWTRLGMGFSTDSTTGDSETLFVSGTTNQVTFEAPGLGKIDPSSHALIPIGDFAYPLSGQAAELTGTGDAKLYGFFTSSPVMVARIAKGASGGGVAISEQKIIGSTPPDAWAFSFWGGSFYLYTSNAGANSTVTEYNPAANTLKPSYTTAPFTIVGAGVSTCAPLTPPA